MWETVNWWGDEDEGKAFCIKCSGNGRRLRALCPVLFSSVVFRLTGCKCNYGVMEFSSINFILIDMPHESLLRRGQLRWTDISEIFVFTDFYVCCQKMAIKIKEIEPRTVSAICLCTHVIVVHSMKLMIRPISPFERGPGEMSVDLLLWFFNNAPSRVNRVNRATAAHTHYSNRIHIRIRIRNSFTKGTAPPMLRVSSNTEAAEAWIAEQRALLTISSSN